MIMKKLLLMTIALMTTLMASAQISVQLGYLLTNEKLESSVGNSSSSYNGFMAAADYNVNLTGNLSIAPGLGLSYSFDNDNGAKYKELGLFAPVDVNYRFLTNNDIALSVFAGPTLFYGLISKDTAPNPTYNYYDNDAKRFELLLGGGLWCDINEMIRLKAGYKFGVLNSSKISGLKAKNNCLYLSVGYLF